MKFIDEAHKDFYENKIKEYHYHGGNIDCYSRAFFYLMGICRETRENFYTLFNMKEHCIILSKFHSGWQTGMTYKICRLAFNLWNGYCYETNEDIDNNISKDFAVDEIFCCEYIEYFFEAIRLRYPSSYYMI